MNTNETKHLWASIHAQTGEKEYIPEKVASIYKSLLLALPEALTFCC